MEEENKQYKFEKVTKIDGVKAYKIVGDHTKHKQELKRAKLRKKRKK